MKILIAESQARVRYGLRVLLEQQPGWEVFAQAATAQELIELVSCGCPDLVLLDCNLPGMPFDSLLTLLHQACPDLRVIAMAGHADLRLAALDAGANAFASKAESPDKLLEAIYQIQEEHIR